MKVLLRRNVPNLGRIGEIVEVKPGYARNFLLPQRLAFEPSAANLRTVDAEKQRYLQELAKERAALVARAEIVQGKEVTISARANEQGHLYGSVGPAQIAAALAAEGVFVESEYVAMDQPIRQLDKYDVTLRFAEDVTATVHVWVVPSQEAPDAEAPPEDAEAAGTSPPEEPQEPAEQD